MAILQSITRELRDLDTQYHAEKLSQPDTSVTSVEDRIERDSMRRVYEASSRQLRQDLAGHADKARELELRCAAQGISVEALARWRRDESATINRKQEDRGVVNANFGQWLAAIPEEHDEARIEWVQHLLLQSRELANGLTGVRKRRLAVWMMRVCF